MNKFKFKELLHNNLGIPESESTKLFTNIERKHLIDINDIISNVPNKDEKKLPNISDKKVNIIDDDIRTASKYQVETETISKLRTYSSVIKNKTTKNNSIDLNTLSDSQKTMLTQISYLDINEEGIKKIKNGGLKVSELRKYLKCPDDQFIGNVINHRNLSKGITDVIVGKDSIVSDKQLLDSIINEKLGDLKITDIAHNENTGFEAMSFKDSIGNSGISYRGSNLGISKDAINDWVNTNIHEYITNESTQNKQALDFFERNKNLNGNNFIYGHSLGGNLTSHTFLENYKEIKEAFTIDGTPINDELLNTQEKINAFNSKKYNCNIVAGDVVGNLKSYKLYENNVHYIKNNDNWNQSLISAHLVQSAEFNNNGEFVEVSRESAIERMNFFDKGLMNVSQKIHDVKDEFFKTDLGKWMKDITDGISNLDKNNDKEISSNKDNQFNDNELDL